MHTVLVIFEGGQKSTAISGSDTILNELEDQGISMPQGCLAGSCGTCKIEIVSGDANIKKAGAVEQDTLKTIYETYPNAKGKILRLACRAKATGDLIIKPFLKK